ncbi:MAG: hypothetical protein RIM72_16935 [Alphaproteobacteria bacterium]
MIAEPDKKAEFKRIAVEMLSSRLDLPTPSNILLETKIEDLEIDSLHFIEWEIELDDRFSFSTVVEFYPESDTVGEVVDRYARALE